jgi:prolyl oligopeptidase
MNTRLAPLVVLLALVGLIDAQQPPEPKFTPPDTPREPETLTMHGMELVEDYRWLEAKDSRDVRDWFTAQNEAALDYIESLPELPAIERRLARIFRNAPPDIRDLQYAQGVFVCKRNESLVVLESEDSPRPARVLLDVEAAPQRRRPSVDYVVLAHRGKYVAAAVSLNGTEEGTIQIFDTATGKALRERIPQAFVAVGGDMTWDFADAGIFYTRYPNAKPDAPLNPKRFARPQIYYHKLGDDLANDRLIVDEPADGDYVSYSLLPAHRQYYLTATTGWGMTDSTTRLYRPDQPAEKRWLPFAGPADKLASLQVAGAAKDRLLLLSHKDAPRGQILTMPLDQTDLTKASVLLPQSKYFLHSILGTDSRLFVVDRLGGSQRLREYTLDGRFVRDLQLPPFCSVEEFTPLEGDTILYKTEGYTQPPTWWYYNARLDLPPKRLGISEKWGINFDDIEVLRDQAQAPDGTRVPLTILRPKGVKLDGERPVYLEGYGGHAHVETPNFVVRRRLWFDAGGVWAIAHPRGEGELGEAWYQQARGVNKAVAADDFIACAQRLIQRRYTNPKRLAIGGGSHGGLLVAMAITRRPDLFAAAIIDCGPTDLIGDIRTVAGPFFNPEYGNANRAEEFAKILTYSPLHAVKPLVQYPPVLIRTGLNDRRVDPSHSWKFAARLQASGTRNPVLLLTIPNEGHQFPGMAAEDLALLFHWLRVRP